MAVLGDIFKFIKTTGERPTPFGTFHILSLIITILVTLIICKRWKSVNEKKVRCFLLIISVAVIFFEIYKQIVFSFTFDGERFIFDYKWHIFPWQFCSTPMFAGLAAALIKNKKIHYMLCAYLASFGLVAGTFTIVSGSSLFSDIVGINIQTAVCHGSMVVIGGTLLSSGYVKSDTDALKAAIPPFLFGAVVAMVLNQLAYLSGIPDGEVFNMYFISPYFPKDQPLLAPIRQILPDPIFQIVYLAVFTLLARATLALSAKLHCTKR